MPVIVVSPKAMGRTMGSSRSTAKPASPYVERAALITFIAVLVLPSVIWILNDHSVWPWDHARYGDWTLRTWEARLLGPVGWFNFMIHALGGTPPLIAWAGQFFVPLQHLTGDFESAMLFFNVCVASGTLLLVYLTARSLDAGILAGLGAIAMCGGSQLFIALTHNYLTEMVQCFATASIMFVAWRAEKRSLVRTLSLALGAVGLSFLSKASSATFVLPFLTYIAVALFVTSTLPKHPTTESDFILLVLATALFGATLAWYFVNWESTVGHFLEAASSDIALYYGSPVLIGTKLKFWTKTLSLALSPFSIVSMCIAIAILLATATAAARLREMPSRRWAQFSVQSGLLFSLALVGTICLTVLGYSLQINEDTRFLLPLIPLIAVLLGWALSSFRSHVLTVFCLVAFAGDAVLAHAYCFRNDPANITPISWLSQIESNAADKLLLTAAVQATCQPEIANRYNILGVNYIRLNGNSANFYAEKERLSKGYRCYYMAFGYDEQNLQHALAKVTEIAPPYILTVPPDRQFPPDFVNIVSKPLGEFLAKDSRYALVPGLGDYLFVYRRAR
jgi:hypothetical protein